MAVCGVLLFIPLIWKLWDIAIVHHEEYQQQATGQQTMDMSVSASRGNIYDRNGSVMAMSATVYNLILSPRDLVASVKKTDYQDEKGNLDQAAYDAAVSAKQSQVASELMALFPDLDRERLEKHIQKTKSAYEILKKNIEEENINPIREYITKSKASTYLYPIAGAKRYYPYSGLAAQTLGFVNDNGGTYGIEAAYNDVLEGTAGRVMTTKTASGTEMYNSYSEYIDAVNGSDITLTIDATIQSYAEKTLQEGIEDFDVQDGGVCIVMEPKTGAILAIANSPDFDPNSYSKILDDRLSQEMDANIQTTYEELKKADTEHAKTNEELMAEAEGKAYNAALLKQWRSKTVSDTYEPGSTFKSIVLAAALEEGVVSESSTFSCSGHMMVKGFPDPIHCARRTGHGTQTLAEAVKNSCNPAFMQIGQKLGVEKFYEYFKAFGMTEPTGIDLPGEEKGLNWGDSMTGVDLAVASFGQRFQVTPLQMITGFCAVVNGGNLMRPYVVQSVTSGDGATVRTTEPTVVRQVVSAQTSATAVKILEGAVASETGTSKNAYMAGCRIGGKTGSSQTTEKGRTIVSFIGFAPADDPKVAVLLAYDNPKPEAPGSNIGTTGVYISGGNMAAVKAGPMIANILDYMGVERQYNEAESAAVDVNTPDVVGQTPGKAQETLTQKNLLCRTVGEGDRVAAQIPAAHSSVPGGSTVVLYLGDARPEESGAVPDVVGMTYENARKKLEAEGFFMRASGVSVYYGNTTTAAEQSIEGGTQAPLGTVVNVRFVSVVEDGAVNTR